MYNNIHIRVHVIYITYVPTALCIYIRKHVDFFVKIMTSAVSYSEYLLRYLL